MVLGAKLYCSTRNGRLLESEPLDVVTSTVPVLAPLGTFAEISVSDTTVYAAGVPWKLTAVAPDRLYP